MKTVESSDFSGDFAVALGRVSRRWRTRLDKRLKHLGLTQARWIALLQISRFQSISQKDLAEQMGVEGPTLVHILDGLEKQKLVERCENGADRRVKDVQLTSSAKPVLREIARIEARLRCELVQDLSTAELTVALRVLQVIEKRLETNAWVENKKVG